MKAQVPRLACTSIASLFLLAGLVYSALALAPTPVYAAACDCNEELQDATILCNEVHGNVVHFICPYNTNQYFVQCSTGQQFTPFCGNPP